MASGKVSKAANLDEACRVTVGGLLDKNDLFANLQDEIDLLSNKAKFLDGVTRDDIKPLIRAMSDLRAIGLDTDERVERAVAFQMKISQQIATQQVVKNALSTMNYPEMQVASKKASYVLLQTREAKQLECELLTLSKKSLESAEGENERLRQQQGEQTRGQPCDSAEPSPNGTSTGVDTDKSKRDILRRDKKTKSRGDSDAVSDDNRLDDDCKGNTTSRKQEPQSTAIVSSNALSSKKVLLPSVTKPPGKGGPEASPFSSSSSKGAHLDDQFIINSSVLAKQAVDATRHGISELQLQGQLEAQRDAFKETITYQQKNLESSAIQIGGNADAMCEQQEALRLKYAADEFTGDAEAAKSKEDFDQAEFMAPPKIEAESETPTHATLTMSTPTDGFDVQNFLQERDQNYAKEVAEFSEEAAIKQDQLEKQLEDTSKQLMNAREEIERLRGDLKNASLIKTDLMSRPEQQANKDEQELESEKHEKQTPLPARTDSNELAKEHSELVSRHPVSFQPEVEMRECALESPRQGLYEPPHAIMEHLKTSSRSAGETEEINDLLALIQVLMNEKEALASSNNSQARKIEEMLVKIDAADQVAKEVLELYNRDLASTKLQEKDLSLIESMENLERVEAVLQYVTAELLEAEQVRNEHDLVSASCAQKRTDLLDVGNQPNEQEVNSTSSEIYYHAREDEGSDNYDDADHFDHHQRGAIGHLPPPQFPCLDIQQVFIPFLQSDDLGVDLIELSKEVTFLLGAHASFSALEYASEIVKHTDGIHLAFPICEAQTVSKLQQIVRMLDYARTSLDVYESILGFEALTSPEAIDSARAQLEDRDKQRRRIIKLADKFYKCEIPSFRDSALLINLTEAVHTVMEIIPVLHNKVHGSSVRLSSIQPSSVLKAVMKFKTSLVSVARAGLESRIKVASTYEKLVERTILLRDLLRAHVLSQEAENLLIASKRLLEDRLESWKSPSIAEQLHIDIAKYCCRATLQMEKRLIVSQARVQGLIEQVPSQFEKYVSLKSEIDQIRIEVANSDLDRARKAALTETLAAKLSTLAALEAWKTNMDEEVRSICGFFDPYSHESGGIKCIFPELYCGVTLAWRKPPQTESERKIDAIQSMLRKHGADLSPCDTAFEQEYDFELEDLSPAELGPMSHAPPHIRLARHRLSRKLYVFKMVMLPPGRLGPEGERKLTEIRRAIIHSRCVPHTSILGCDGAVVKSTSEIWMRFEYQSGGDLLYWSKTPARNIARRLDALAQVANALSALHTQRIYHRDVKPQNIVMTSLEDDATARLTDFELSKKDVGYATYRTIAMRGTPFYMAPELLLPNFRGYQDASAYAGCDIYSFAATAVHVLCSEHLNDSYDADFANLIETHGEDLRAKLDALTQTGHAIVEILSLALSEDPEMRPSWKQIITALSPRACAMLCGGTFGPGDGVPCSDGCHFYCSSDLQAIVEHACLQGRESDWRITNDPLTQNRSLAALRCPKGMEVRGDCEFGITQLARALPRVIDKVSAWNQQFSVNALKVQMTAELAICKNRIDELKAERSFEALVDHHVQQLSSAMLNKCPRCKEGFDDFDGCCALTCARRDCQAKFCALCLAGPFEDAHRHVMSCMLNPTRNSPQPQMHLNPDQIRDSQQRRREKIVQDYLASLTDVELIHRIQQATPDIRAVFRL